jgi:hypothetical protein
VTLEFDTSLLFLILTFKYAISRRPFNSIKCVPNSINNYKSKDSRYGGVAFSKQVTISQDGRSWQWVPDKKFLVVLKAQKSMLSIYKTKNVASKQG